MNHTTSTITTTSLIPPCISQAFDRKLLSIYSWKDLMEAIPRWTKMAADRYRPGSRKMKSFALLIETIERLHEWKKEKEAYQRAKSSEDKEIAQSARRPHFPFEQLYKIRGELGKSLRDAYWKRGVLEKRAGTWKDRKV